MSSIIEAVIQHEMSPEEILTIPELLNDLHLVDNTGSKWAWTSKSAGVDFLKKYWRTTPEDFIEKRWDVTNLAVLELKLSEYSRLTLHFYQPNLVSFDTHLPSSRFENDIEARVEFTRLVKLIALVMRATDTIIINNWYYDHAFDFSQNLTVDVIRQKTSEMKLPFYEII